MSRMKKPFAAPGTPRVPVAEFTPEMKRTHTILIPMMLPIHFELIEKVLQNEGYKTELLRTEGSEKRPQRHLLSRPAGHRADDGCPPQRKIRSP